MVGHHPTNKLIGREPIPHQKNLSKPHHAAGNEYPVLATVSGSYPEEGGRLLTCYSPVRHSSTPASWGFTVRLACVKHAASVRPEPGSNSPKKLVKNNPQWPRPQQGSHAGSQTINNSEKNISRLNPPRNRRGSRGEQTKTKQTNQTTKPPHNRAAPAIQNAHYGIKNMTHYRVLKQHTHPALIATFP